MSSNPEAAARHRAAPALWVITVPVTLSAVAVVRWAGALIANRNRGIDVSDEGYYLLAALDPAGGSASVSDFGFYLRPLLAVTGSVGRFRMIGLLLVLATAWAAALAVRDAMSATVDRRRSWIVVAASWLMIAASVLTYYALWLVTPSYNLLALVLGMLAAASTVMGVARLDHDVDTDIRWFVVGLGAVVAWGLTIKPSAFVAVGLICAATLVFVGGVGRAGRRVMELLGGVVVGLAVHWVVSVQWPHRDLERLRRGAEAFRRLRSHPSERVFETEFLRETVLWWFVALMGVALVLLLSWRWVRRPRMRLVIVSIGAMVTMVPLLGSQAEGGTGLLASGSGWWWLRLTALALVWTTATAAAPRRVHVLGPAIALLAPATALGSNNGIVRQTALVVGPLAMAVLVQAALVARDREGSELALALVPVSVFVAVGAIHSLSLVDDATRDPYRLGAPLDTEVVEVTLGSLGSIEARPETASYLRELAELAGEVDPDALSCFVDLTGSTPLAAVALGADPAGLKWMSGGYPGSAESAAYVIEQADCLDGPVALLEAPRGVRSIPRPEVLAAREFEEVARLDFSGYVEEQQVLSVAPAQSPEGR